MNKQKAPWWAQVAVFVFWGMGFIFSLGDMATGAYFVALAVLVAVLYGVRVNP